MFRQSTGSNFIGALLIGAAILQGPTANADSTSSTLSKPVIYAETFFSAGQAYSIQVLPDIPGRISLANRTAVHLNIAFVGQTSQWVVPEKTITAWDCSSADPSPIGDIVVRAVGGGDPAYLNLQCGSLVRVTQFAN